MTTRPGEGRYARTERERRWLLPGLPDDVHDPIRIEDHYLPDTGLRLRRSESDAGIFFKLGQKVRVRPWSPSDIKLTTIYLTEPEYGLLAGLGGARLDKTRWRWRPGKTTFAVDRFHGDLAGLVLAEVELGATDQRVDPPPGALDEVTEDDRFTGGTLAELSPEDAAHLVVGVTTWLRDEQADRARKR